MRRFVNYFGAALVAACVFWGPRTSEAARPWLHQLNEIEQGELSALILSYLTEEEIHWHMNINHQDPQSFFHGHRAYIQRLEAYLLRNGAGRYVPLPKWDPATPIPGTFRMVNSNYQQLENFEIGMQIPVAFRGQALRQFDSMPTLFQAISPWHDQVHVRVGGCMGDLMTAPAAPIFFCWHACVDDLFDEWAYYTNYRIPVSFENEFPSQANHMDHGGHSGDAGPVANPGGHSNHTDPVVNQEPWVAGVPHDHGCVCGPNCRCGPNCQCPQRDPDPVPEPVMNQGGYGTGSYQPGGFPSGGYPQGGYGNGSYQQGGFQGNGFPQGGYSPGSYNPNPGGYFPGQYNNGGYVPGNFRPGNCPSGNNWQGGAYGYGF